MSSSLLWLYPPSVPLISGNIIKVLQVAERDKLPIKLFTAVPYVIELCAGREEVMKRMVEMDMVGVGGAPLEAEVGAKLIKRGVKLISRFGSSECGFLMSSYRDFATDQNWDYLRVLPGCTTLRFESQEKNRGRVELVVLPGWPQIAKPNRPDGSYATGDLFLPHPTIENAYKYDGRSDLIIVLSNGKKFDPTHIEEAFKEYSLVNEAMVFGNNRPFPGLLLFMNVHRVLFGDIKEYVQEVNQKTHIRIMEEMVVVLCADEHPPKNSKGTLMRGAVDEIYSKEIQKAYEMFECHGPGERMKITDLQGVTDTVRAIVGDITGKEVGDDADLFNAGVDSVMTAQIRNRLTKGLDIQQPLPLNVVFEQRTIEGIVRFITTCGEENGDSSDRQEELMLQLVQKYTDSIGIRNTDLGRPTDTKNGHVIIITGVTGALGAHIFNQLHNSREGIAKIVCLCRASDNSHALSRVEKSLKARKLPGLGGVGPKVMAVAAELGCEYLGLDKRIYDQLKKEVTRVIHAAWAVNFVASLESFEKDHIAGAHNLINLALESTNCAKFYFCSSTAAVLGDFKHPETIQEAFTNDPHTAAPLGYSRSKWVTEKICQKLSFRAAVLRIGQLCGDTVHGVWNETEAWPLMFASANIVGCLPELQEKLSWLPVDQAARIVLDIALSDHLDEVSGDPVFNVVNTDTSTSWSNVLDWIQELDDAKFNRVSPSAWIRKLANAKSGTANPSQKLLGLWESKYGQDTYYSTSNDGETFEFETKNMVTFSNVLGKHGGWQLHRQYVQNIWRNWVQTGFVKV
ncbi:uncharacterized protein H6S33_012641 [Morchella sextelata]|uniref:uncharacterized protein n=1 Tax=Morchella sextelata TaxID=1174677 RepID=UPI001D04B4DC|nr:uncharacterized protein H6S33_012641 [Morchella sextelata]KAH0610095.1 hypothetical protein H6S33_012641 [Morchella sextelata]